MEDYEDLTGKIIGAAMKVHRTLGSGFLESVYQQALQIELCRMGLKCASAQPIKVHYEGFIVGDFVADLLVEERVIVELKAVSTLAPVHEVQTVNYLAATGIKVGLLLNFGAPSLQFKRKHRPAGARSGASRNNNFMPSPARRRIIDITHPHSAALASWPGDTAFQFGFVARLRDGASCNVGTLTTSIHSGTHADAPYHYDDAGLTIDAVPPEIFIGPARVFLAQGADPITREVFAGLDGTATPRVLLRTNACDDKTVFPARIPTLAPDVPAWLGEQGVQLIGLDVPSVDQVDSKTLPIHHALHAAGIYILENLDLRDAGPGLYELIALPLKIAGADGSPIRAVLREAEPGEMVLSVTATPPPPTTEE